MDFLVNNTAQWGGAWGALCVTIRTWCAYLQHTGTFPCSITFSLYFCVVPTPVCAIYASCLCPFYYFSTPNDHVSSLRLIPPAYLLKLNSELLFLHVMFLYVFPSSTPCVRNLRLIVNSPFIVDTKWPSGQRSQCISVMRPADVFRSLQVLYCTVHVDFYICLKLSGLTFSEAGRLQNQ
jgi:hypothetical protein